MLRIELVVPMPHQGAQKQIIDLSLNIALRYRPGTRTSDDTTTGCTVVGECTCGTCGNAVVIGQELGGRSTVAGDSSA